MNDKISRRTALRSLPFVTVACAWAFGTPAYGRSRGTPSSLPALPVSRGNPVLPQIALTFDACQATHQKPGYDAKIIAVLQATQTPATLFLGGLWMQSFPGETKRLAENPLFELGQHSWDHPDFTRINTVEMAAQLAKTQTLMARLTGRAGTLMRFPYGRYNATAIAVAQAHGLIPVQWDVVSGDPSPSMLAPRLITKVVSHTRNGSIIIVHINGRGWHSAEALPTIIAQLRARGFRFVTVSDMLNAPN